MPRKISTGDVRYSFFPEREVTVKTPLFVNTRPKDSSLEPRTSRTRQESLGIG